ncbi:hypothetical protein ACH5RR_003366 [Cinchona calisaya]|uniref:Uncharacterized protein n=1 Tax=Cinchona calisaya TaxID=153742 RepID=A0ABD3AUS2_9GENT
MSIIFMFPPCTERKDAHVGQGHRMATTAAVKYGKWVTEMKDLKYRMHDSKLAKATWKKDVKEAEEKLLKAFEYPKA